MSELRELYLTDCKKLKAIDLINFLNNTAATGLERLDFKGITPPTSELFQALSKHPTLKYVNLNYINPFFQGQTFTDDDLSVLIRSLPELNSLLLNNCLKKKKVKTIEEIPRQLINLKELGLNGCDSLSDKFFDNLVEQCKEL